MLLLMVATSFGVTPSANDARGTFRNSYAWSGNVPRDKATLWAQAMEGAVDVGQRLGTGEVFYVDSNATGDATGSSFVPRGDNDVANTVLKSSHFAAKD